MKMQNLFGKGRSNMHEFRKLSEGIYAFLQPALIWYSNAGVIVGDRDVIKKNWQGRSLTRNFLTSSRSFISQNMVFRLNWITRLLLVGPVRIYSGMMKADKFFAKAFPKPKASGMVYWFSFQSSVQIGVIMIK
jgi:hypothetical protein